MARKEPEFTKRKFEEMQKAQRAQRRSARDREILKQHGPCRILVQGGIVLKKPLVVPVDTK